jgi:ubiquinone/menaquinone biosynthesis C-methylase UbiE
MKALENKAKKYDKGIKILTLGRLPDIKKNIANNLIRKNETLLDIGMGTGSFAILCAKNGVKVTGVDSSIKMLNVAREKIDAEELSDVINIIKASVIELDEQFSGNSFDKVTAILVFSELYQTEQDFCLAQIHRILKEKGEFILVDEVKPKNLMKKIIYYFVRTPFILITYLKSQLTTKYLNNIEQKLMDHDFLIVEEKCYLFDTLKLIRSRKK